MKKAICVLVLCGFASAACAQTDASAPLNAAAPSAASGDGTAPQATPADTVVVKSRARVAPADRNCLRETGSRIPTEKNRCNPVNGRAYSRDDLDRTGAPTIGEALQHLDTAVTIRH